MINWQILPNMQLIFLPFQSNSVESKKTRLIAKEIHAKPYCEHNFESNQNERMSSLLGIVSFEGIFPIVFFFLRVECMFVCVRGEGDVHFYFYSFIPNRFSYGHFRPLHKDNSHSKNRFRSIDSLAFKCDSYPRFHHFSTLVLSNENY